MRRVFWFIRRLVGRNRYRAELRAEIDATFDILVAEYREKGMPEPEARIAARRDLGDADAIGERTRDAWSGARIEQCVRDTRYTLRGLRRNPGFALAAIITFGLAIGGTTAVGTLVDALLLRPLPFPDSERIVMVLQRSVGSDGAGHVASQPNIDDWRLRNRVFQRMAYYEYMGFNIAGAGTDPLQAPGLRTSHELFSVLRARPLLGRTFIEADDAGKNGDVVVLSHALWRDRFGGDSSLIGRTITVNRRPHTVIGVMPSAFRFPSGANKLWVPIGLTDNDRSRGSQSVLAIARLTDDVPLDVAQRDMRRVAEELAREFADANAGESVNVFPLRDLWMHDVQRILRLLSAAVLLVALIAIANVAGLLLARGGARSRELGARLALGGSRGRLIGQLVTESTVIAVLGGALGVAIAYVTVPIVVALPGLGLTNLPFHDVRDIAINGRILVAAIAIATLAGIVAGLIPALSVIPSSPADLLKHGEARGATARTRNGLRGMLIAVEVGLAVVVLVGAGLLIDSVRRAVGVEPGLDPRAVTLMGVSLPQADSYGVPERPLFCAQLQERAGHVSGVTAVSAVSHVPFSGQNAGRSFVVEGAPPPGPNGEPGASYGVVCPDYFRTMGITLRRGRDFSSQDVVAAPQVVIVNETFARKFFGDENAVGKRIRLGTFEMTDAPWATIIGVAGDVRHEGLVADVRPYLYRPYTQGVWPYMTVAVRTSTSARQVVDAVRESVRAVVPDEPVGEPRAMHDVVDGSLAFMRFPLVVMIAFAIIAGLLTAVGVFGVASQIVVGRTRELGIRRALGATRAHLYRLVIVQTLAPAAIGLAGGLLIARLSGTALGGLLYGVSPTDPSTFAVMSGVLATLTILACLAPARRAASVDPAQTLRHD
jgi:predicted permease